MSRFNYQPRGDFVIFRMQQGNTVRGLAMPDISELGMTREVVSMGPEVKSLEIGDRVLVVSTDGSVAPIPGERDLFITRQSNIVVVIRDKAPEVDLSN